MTKPIGIADPIESLFTLSGDVARQAPQLRRDFFWGQGVALLLLVVFIALGASLTYYALQFPPVVLFGLLIFLVFDAAFCYVAYRGFAGARKGSLLLRDFLRRHRAILAIRDANPVVPIPPGPDLVQRYLRYLRTQDPRVAALLARKPESMWSPAEWRTKAGRVVRFDFAVVAPGSRVYRWFGLGRPGWAMLGRAVANPPSLEDLSRIREDARDITTSLPAHPERLILLRSGSDALSDPVYDDLVRPPGLIRKGLGRRATVSSVISEAADGTYDFIPHIVDVD